MKRIFKHTLALIMSVIIIAEFSSCEKNNDKTVSEEGVGKKIIKLYGFYIDDEITGLVSKFNKSSSEYKIEVTDYWTESQYRTEQIAKLNNDLVAGNLPDILILNGLDVDSYISKGLFSNIYDFIDNDPDMNRSDFVENIFKAYEIDGKLYEVVPRFTIGTLVGRTSLVGEEPDWTMEEFIDFVNSYPDRSVFGGYRSKDMVLKQLIDYGYNSYIDRKTGECHFNSDEFIRLLEFCNQFPKESEISDTDNPDYDTELRNGNILLTFGELYNFYNIREYEQGRFGEAVTFKGFPGIGGNGLVIRSLTKLAVISDSNNPEGAWEFVKYFYSEEYQDQYSTVDSWEFPIRLSSLEKQAEENKVKRYIVNESGENEYYDNFVYISGKEVIIGENTDEDNKHMFEVINSADSLWQHDSFISDIVMEESAAYFEGQKSSQEVADIIQNRISNYIAENR